MILLSDKKVDFIPYATAFLGFMIQYIPDINFKISLSTIKIICKLELLIQIYSKTIANEWNQL